MSLNGSEGMLGIADQHKSRRKAGLEQMQPFLEGSEEIRFEASGHGDVYEWAGRTLGQQGYKGLPKPGTGLVKRYIRKGSGLGRAQVTGLVSQYVEPAK